MTQSPASPLPSPQERRRLREACSLTQAQVAVRVGVSSETVRAWESGRTTPRGGRREAYARLLTLLAEREQEREQERAGDQEAVAKPEVTGHQGGAARNTRPAGPAAVTPEHPAALATEDPAAIRAEEPPPAPGPRPELPLTPAQAFDALYAFCAPALVRQTYLLTGRRELARESVERAFQLAWQRWPEVARDRDPAGWVRATAYDFALSPWHRLRPRYRHPEPPPSDASDRALLDVLLKLPPPQRRTLLLYDGVGLDLPETAAETEATTPAAANRLLHARAAIADRLPGLSDPAELHHRLAELAATERLRAAKPTMVRDGSERRARFWTRAAIAFTVALIGTTALTLRTAPTQYEPPVPPGATVRGVPPRVAPGPLSDKELKLRAKLRGELQNGPERLAPHVE
ncbi:DNA-directed RNA polymerase subunit sigma-24 [Streptomyces viridochromogenes]|uniref:DNA-directed RNA polymerase subunit sigma-24 n=1 Tax=Streptomyces viridochromogenes TaxID=1938 RepID=A0A0J7YTJ4_STRVR|nr:sigma factor-like helix-turn-helix DNA-binding protein [Streptomyces viridochromogenes]KMS66824.1 DNA-directed RNA polymerase subunit sigma-24 [Streptomyces viridochromogenes]